MHVPYIWILQLGDVCNERNELVGYTVFTLLFYFYMVNYNYVIALPSVFFHVLSVCHPVPPLLHIRQSLGLIQPKE